MTELLDIGYWLRQVTKVLPHQPIYKARSPKPRDVVAAVQAKKVADSTGKSRYCDRSVRRVGKSPFGVHEKESIPELIHKIGVYHLACRVAPRTVQNLHIP